MFRRGASAVLLACTVATAVGLAAQVQPRRGLTGAAELARAYDAIFDARFEAVPALLARACGPAPPQACQLLETVAIWWRIQIDPFNRSRDASFRSHAEAALAATSAWTAREPDRAEAWFYLGGAYAVRAQWRSLRGQRLGAARDGKRIKEALEHALTLDPEMADAYFGLGLYHYYADVAPTVFKMLRWLFLLPGGNRVKGLEEALRARHSGLLLRSEADYQLHLIYLWYERQPQRALALLAELQARHPRNPHFREAAAKIHDVYLNNAMASLEAWQMLLDEALRRQVAEPQMAEAAARLGIALQLDRLSRSEAAIEHLRAVIAARPSAPFGAVARAHLQRGQALDRLGRRADAAAAYRDAIAATPPADPLGIAANARAALRAHRP